MIKNGNLQKLFLVLLCLMFNLFLYETSISSAFAATSDNGSDPRWTIYYRPAVRFGSDDRTLYINDFLIPIYQDDKNIFFNNTKFTPNDQDGWEVNLGLGYRHYSPKANLILGINGFYDQRKTPWGSFHEQWGIGAEAMSDVPIGNMNLGLTGRFNYYWPLTSADIQITPNTDARFIFKGHGIYALDPLIDAYVEEPVGGFDAEMGVRVPYVSDFVETWVYGGGYRFDGKYTEPIDGVSARIEVIPTDFLRLNYEFRSDRTATEQHYGEVSVEVPFSIDNLIAGKNPFEGLGKRLGGSREMKERLVEPVRRDVDVKLCEYTGDEALAVLVANGELSEIEVSPGLMEEIIFVSENGVDTNLTWDQSTGTWIEGVPLDAGTYEHPLKSIGLAFKHPLITQNVKLIHVMDSTDNLEVGGGEAFVEGITIWGAGSVNVNYPRTINLQLGYPTVGDTLTVSASNVTVRGLEFNIGTLDLLEDSAIELKGGPFGILKGVKIEGNKFIVSKLGDAYGVKTSSTLGLDPIIPIINPLIISGNNFTVTSSLGTAYGINLSTLGTLGIKIVEGNTFTINGGINGAYGIKLVNEGRDKGTVYDTFDIFVDNSLLKTTIASNNINVETEKGYGFGIYCSTEDSYLDANIYLNNITAKKTGGGLLDIALVNPDSLSNPLIVTLNDLMVPGAPYIDPGKPKAYGIFLKSDRNLGWTTLKATDAASGALSAILDPVPTVGSSAAGLIAGTLFKCAELEVYKEFFESGTVYANMHHNVIDVTGNEANALGISVLANDDISTELWSNLISANGALRSYGINLKSDKNINAFVHDHYINVSSNEGYGISCEAGNKIFTAIGKGSQADYDLLALTFDLSTADFESYRATHSIPGDFVMVNANDFGYGIRLASGGSLLMNTLNLELSYFNQKDRDINALIQDNQDIFVHARNKAFGVYLKSIYSIGEIDSPSMITNNTIRVTSDQDSAWGIYGFSEGACKPIPGFAPAFIPGTIFATISGNIVHERPGSTNPNIGGISVIGAGNSYGIFLEAGDIGTESSPSNISHNTMNVNSTNAGAIGIYLNHYDNNYDTAVYRLVSEFFGLTDEYNREINASIGNNDMSFGITGKDSVWGIALNSVDIDTSITKNRMRVESSDGLAYGVYVRASEDLSLSISRNGDCDKDKDTPWIDVSGRTGAFGISFWGKTKSEPGDTPWSVDFIGNNIRVLAYDEMVTGEPNKVYGIYGLIEGGSLSADISANIIKVIGEALNPESESQAGCIFAYGIGIDSKDGQANYTRFLDTRISGNDIGILNNRGASWGIYNTAETAFLLSKIHDNTIASEGTTEYFYSECGGDVYYNSNGILLQSYAGFPGNYPQFTPPSGATIGAIGLFLQDNFADKNIPNIREVLWNSCMLYTSMEGNTITAGSELNSYGISCIAGESILVDISNNEAITVTGGPVYLSAEGISLRAGLYGHDGGGKIMSFLNGNKKIGVSGAAAGYGIMATAYGDLYAYIGGDDYLLSNKIEVHSQNDANGIYLTSTTGGLYGEIGNNLIDCSSSFGDSLGVYLNAAKIGIDCDERLQIKKNRMGISSSRSAVGLLSYSGYDTFADISENTIHAVSETGYTTGMRVDTVLGGITVDITDNDMSEGVSGETGARGIVLAANRVLNSNISGSITGNRINIESGSTDALGVFFMTNSGNSVVCDNPDITVTTDTGYGFDTIDAMIVDSLTELNNEITNGTTGWIYLKAGDYSGTVNPIERGLSLWGAHYQMLGLDSTGWSTLNSPLTFSGTTARALGLSIDTEGPYGISVLDGMKCDFIGNQITVSDPVGDTYGISVHSGGDIGSATRPTLVLDNTLNVTADNGSAFGLSFEGLGSINTMIENNIINVTSSGSDKDAWGILLSGEDRVSPDGSSMYTDLVNISDNTLKVISEGGGAAGIYGAFTNGILTADIVNNDMTGGGYNNIGVEGVKSAVGIYLNSHDYSGTISDNKLKTLSTEGTANGISISSNDSIMVDISRNELGKTEGVGDTYGTRLVTYTGNIDANISENYFELITGLEGSISGLSIESGNDLFADISWNSIQCAAPYNPTGLDVWVIGKDIYLFNLSANGDIGSIDRPLNIYEDYVGGTNLSFAPWAHVWDQCLADGTITGDDLLEHVEGIGLSLTAGENIYADYNSLTDTGGIRNSSFWIGSYGDVRGLYAQSGNDLFIDILNSSIFAENSTERTDTSIYVTGIELVAGNTSSGLGSIGSADNPVTISDSWICAEAYDNDVYVNDLPSTPKSTPSSARAFGVIHKAALDIFSRITNNSIDVGSTGETYGLNLFTGYEEPDGQLGGGVIGTYDSPVIIDQNILNVYAHCVTPTGVPLWIDQYNSNAGGYIDMGVGDPGSGGNEIYRYSFDYYFEIPGPGFIGNYGINNEVLDNASPIPGSYIYP